MTTTNVNEGKPVVDAEPVEKDGKHPENVSWTQYVGIKEKFTRVETELKTKVASLEEQLKKAPNPEEFTKIKGELDTVKADHKKVSDELTATKERSISEKRNSLITKGVPAEKVKDLSEKELDAISGVLGTIVTEKPKADFGNGGGGNTPASSKERFARGFAALHPKG
jgi:hypothetical protein